ncbi:hypothetical protein [Cochleicola gelatinilyticus]|uniref:Uncharacterized protein n=1 Tax=Cochleicola gelatinilyticus TaxID=1763537 RepID=A0A167IJY1_9FLAO|nr:hypothetical protein [Cochleicola gelatinilyticus]OAB79730.1 hypothetical protein ULVI_03015 [Cochleicola gelatinilyticus]
MSKADLFLTLYFELPAEDRKAIRAKIKSAEANRPQPAKKRAKKVTLKPEHATDEAVYQTVLRQLNITKAPKPQAFACTPLQ